MRVSGILGGTLLALCFAGPVQAAEEWGLPAEQKARFEAKVVDVLCELTGNCAPECGAGARHLGLLRDDGTLVLPFKNFTPFAGASSELVELCGRRVVADGLFTTNRGYRIFALQFVRPAPDGAWRRANRFLGKWAERFGLRADGNEAREWFRHDPRVKAEIAKDGKLGLGPEADKAYFADQ